MNVYFETAQNKSESHWQNYELSYGVSGSDKYSKRYELNDLEFFKIHDKI